MILSLSSHWTTYSEYRKIVATIDMMLARIRSHPLAPIRVATLASRYSQCGAIQALGYLWETLGWPREKLGAYIWIDGIAQDLVRILKKGEELGAPHSYFPNAVDLGVITTSPYAASRNPRFNIFCHVIGALLGNPRSINAFYQPGSLSIPILDNAKVVAYVVHSSANFKMHLRPSNIRGRCEVDKHYRPSGNCIT